MKFVFFGYDFMIGVVKRLLDDGHTLGGLYSFPCDGIFNFNNELLAMATAHNIPFSLEKPVAEDIKGYISAGCTCFVSAGYLYKIPSIDERHAYGINLHPSYLPKGRGIMPTPYILTRYPEAAGVSIHKLTDRFDGGDVLIQRKINLSSNETVESYSARIALHAPDMVSDVVQNLEHMWLHATPQNEAESSHFSMPDNHMRVLDLSKDVHIIKAIGRAFGRYGTIMKLDGVYNVVYDFDVIEEAHNHRIGKIIIHQPKQLILSAKNGYVVIKEWKSTAL